VDVASRFYSKRSLLLLHTPSVSPSPLTPSFEGVRGEVSWRSIIDGRERVRKKMIKKKLEKTRFFLF
jgi:hypothetical protein